MRMPFAGRIERAQKLSSDQAKMRMGRYDEDIAPADMMEKGDGLAMFIAAMITIVPVCLAALAVLALVGYLFILH